MTAPITGRITATRDEGTIVLVTITDPAGNDHFIPCDRRMFAHMYEGQRGRLLDRPVTVVDEAGQPLALQFDDIDEDEVVYPLPLEGLR